jgi:hypothetical protein
VIDTDGAGRKFMEMTQYKNMTNAPQKSGAPQPPFELPMEPGASIMLLPSPKTGFGSEPLIDIINRRRSIRSYSGAKLSLEELSFLLWCC